MIRFSLHCDKDHEFEGWFGSSRDFDGQSARGMIDCPVCGSRQVSKALMAPAVTVSREAPVRPLAMDPEKREMMRKLREMVQAVKQNSEDVGDRFADEARKIHHGEAEVRGIIGQASSDDARSLIEEGIEIAPLPEFPEDLS
ncbi:MAG: DUF1178 family protein [Hoeflea sp.]|uniref:DUF1178 family protein n=1 Tax=Hoeflea sp. TaxID=1940281 RepID=UPI001DC9004D|nr:DUF1178 family protein [Hoeflea sp.]MBU4528691.1 DUF1178 family protein [Alphaproteobacteria bacterium]MBU4545504.1 DUF1178 family protein [Alphaproteobacteria bacterium]MBU4552114.1 DUF1178 family protein [Alphaproteobacteria bacterium]MBV1726294.1 DUF1178 family protein [Hoeflea sp.]MBV1762279.1 DUF1178 family protein [Hoeflea sp.]